VNVAVGSPGFSAVTERQGTAATQEQVAMIMMRYQLAAELARGARVLEVACGPGRGLGLIGRAANALVGGDVTFALVAEARGHYGSRVPVLQFDAEALPFADSTFDLLVCFEAIYYLAHPERFVDEAARILTPAGTVLISTANCESPHFLGSRFSTRFLGAEELVRMLAAQGFHVDLRAAFPAVPPGALGRLSSVARQTASRLRLIPDTLAAREKLKRMFCGPLTYLGPEIDAAPLTERPKPITPTEARNYKILYVLATRTQT
jgi:SAM-dependent methyltransferase